MQENKFLIDSLEESKQSSGALTATINILNDKIMKAEIEASKHHFKKDELEASIKQLKKKYNEVQKESEKNVKDLVKSNKVNEKEAYNLNKNLENARSTIKSLKSESSKLKTCKNKLEADVKKLEKLLSEGEKKKREEPLGAEKRHKNRNIKKSKVKDQTEICGDDSFLVSSICSSMASHCNLNNTKEFQSPYSLLTMVAHLHHAPHATASLSNSYNSLSKTSNTNCKEIELEEKPEGFIGPRLPRMLTDEECEALFKKLLGEKYN